MDFINEKNVNENLFSNISFDNDIIDEINQYNDSELVYFSGTSIETETETETEQSTPEIIMGLNLSTNKKGFPKSIGSKYTMLGNRRR